MGLLMIGKIFIKYGESDTKKGLKMMKDQISNQMGGAAQNTANPDEKKDENNTEGF